MSKLQTIGVLALVTVPLVAFRARELAAPLQRLLRAVAPLAIVAAVLVVGVAFAGRSEFDGPRYLVETVGLSTLCFGLLWLLAMRFEGATLRIFEALAAVPIAVLGVAVFGVSLTIKLALLEDIPHVADEAAYLFQARAYGQGLIGFEVPARVEFFEYIHMSRYGGVWHGIMNPGWPALLAPFQALGLGFLANPLFSALTVGFLAAALARAGAGPLAARLAALGLAFSPFLLVLGGTYMSHPSNLLMFAIFLWAWAHHHHDEDTSALRSFGWAALAGAVLGINAVVRPLDAAATALPFGIWQLVRALREPRRLPALAATGLLAAAGLGILLAYNAALTGNPWVLPTELHFKSQYPGLRFGFGFGADMGTPLHGDEWPGFYPSDVPRITAQRLARWLNDLYGLPLIVMLGAVGAAASARRDPWRIALLASAAAVVLVYSVHFYHGIAYGSRHYASAVPGVVAAIAILLAQRIAAGGEIATALRAAVVALLAHVVIYTAPSVVDAYSDHFWNASGFVREATEREGLSNALVFAPLDGGAWKSAFPLNEYPLESNDVLFARDLGDRNRELIEDHPGRHPYRIEVDPDRSVRFLSLR